MRIVFYAAGLFILRWWMLLPRHLDVHAGDVYALAFSPDGKTLASMNGSPLGKHQFVLWDVQTGADFSWDLHFRRCVLTRWGAIGWLGWRGGELVEQAELVMVRG